MITDETTIGQALPLYQVLVNELLQCTSQAIILLNRSAEIVFCTPSIRFITGHESAELIGKNALNFLHGKELSAAIHHFRYLMYMSENSFTSVLQIPNNRGDLIWIDMVVKNLLHRPDINALVVVIKKSGDTAEEEHKLLQAMTEAKEEERELLASELHDNINQLIVATKLLVDNAQLKPNKEELLRLSSANLQLVAEEIRRLTYSMVSYDLHKYGLTYAVTTFLTTLNNVSAMEFHFRLEESAVKELTPEQELHLYRIIQEGTTNILRHAEASRAEITLTWENGRIYLNIGDNGNGFPLERHQPGIGLSNIANRVKLLKGHFHVRAPQGRGTFIKIHFPV